MTIKTIRVIDLETTCLAPPDGDTSKGVCEIGWCDVVVYTTIDGWVVDNEIGSTLCDPGTPFTPENSAIHHIIERDVEGQGQFLDHAMRVFHPRYRKPFAEFEIVALAAHNAKFEAQWVREDLRGGLPLICTYKTALRHWPQAPKHTNQVLRYWRNPVGLNRALAHLAHRAGPDAYVTAFLLRDMLNDGVTLEQMIEWTKEPALSMRCYIGAWRGKLWSEVDYGFLTWVLSKDFDEDIKHSVNYEIKRRRDEAAKARADDEWRRQHAENPE
jgi:exodeoxyribonuclease X